jgi:hypothetical protein
MRETPQRTRSHRPLHLPSRLRLPVDSVTRPCRMSDPPSGQARWALYARLGRARADGPRSAIVCLGGARPGLSSIDAADLRASVGSTEASKSLAARVVSSDRCAQAGTQTELSCTRPPPRIARTRSSGTSGTDKPGCLAASATSSSRRRGGGARTCGDDSDRGLLKVNGIGAKSLKEIRPLLGVR